MTNTAENKNPDAPEHDTLIPDAQVRRELGDVTSMTTWRYDRDPKMIELGWPPPVIIRKRIHRSRKQFELFKGNLLRHAIEQRGHLVKKEGAR